MFVTIEFMHEKLNGKKNKKHYITSNINKMTTQFLMF